MSAARRQWTHERRLAALWPFAIAISIVNLLGHAVLGFEQPAIVPFVALATGYSVELLLEAIGAWSARRPPRFLASRRALVEFLLPTHISSLAVGMLLYANQRLWAVAFAAATAIASKVILRVPAGRIGPTGVRPTRHVLNPSNVAISATLFLFPWVTAAPPYQFVENVSGRWDWVLTLILCASGTFLNARLTGRFPLIAGWVCGFAVQGVARALANGTPMLATLAPMTGIGFVLYTFYMITDPGTTPETPKAQVAFGASVAAVYGTIVQSHHLFAIFYALTLVGAGRGAWLAFQAWRLPSSPVAMRPLSAVSVAR
jgi:hypothetical protein